MFFFGVVFIQRAMDSNPTSPEFAKKPTDAIERPSVVDEYGFFIDDRWVEDYKQFEVKHEERKERMLEGIWKDVKLSTSNHIVLISC